jgi:hypothetical protein
VSQHVQRRLLQGEQLETTLSVVISQKPSEQSISHQYQEDSSDVTKTVLVLN